MTDQGGNGTTRVVNGVPMPCWNINDSDQYTDVRGFQITKRNQHAFPRPTRVTLGMHLSNTFSSLESSHNDESVPEQNCCALARRAPDQRLPQSQKAQKAEQRSQRTRASLVDNAMAMADFLPSRFSQSLLDSQPDSVESNTHITKGSDDDRDEVRESLVTTTAENSNVRMPLRPLRQLVPSMNQVTQDTSGVPQKPRSAAQSTSSMDWAAFKFSEAMFPSLCAEVHKELNHVEQLMILEEQDDLNAVQEKIKIQVTMDSGAVTHVIHPRALPAGIDVVPNTSGKHFSGASGDTIERFGDCRAQLTTLAGGEIDCGWDLAEVSRPLHAVSKITGPIGDPKHDVLFSNRTCIVVPPGFVEHVLKYVKPIAEYPRQGNLYQAEMVMAPFGRQGS